MKLLVKKPDLRAFTRAISDLSRHAGESIERVSEYEAGKVLEGAVRNTDAMTTARMVARHDAAEFTRQDLGDGLKVYNLSWRYPDKKWLAIKRARAQSLRRKRAARGLSKQAWERLAAAAGLEIRVPGFVKKAVPTTGRTYPQNAVARRIGSGGRFSIRFTTMQPTLEFAKGRGALQKAINARTRYFETNLRRGVFDDVKQVARRYPGLRITA